MKRNTFYLVFGCIALALLFIFWYSVELHTPLIIEIAFILGIVLVYLAKRKVTDSIDDERDVKITEQATIRTMQVFWIVFCAFSIGAVMQILHIPTFPRDPSGTRPPDLLGPRMIGYIQLGLLCLMIFLYVAFRIYYAKKYGILKPMKNKIKIFRAMHNLTQEDLARAIGVNRQTILAIEKEKYIPSLDLAFKISRYFGVNIEEVFIFDEKTPTIMHT